MKSKKSVGPATATKKPASLDAGEQQLWDNVALNLIQQGKDGTQAAKGADLVIAGRRGAR